MRGATPLALVALAPFALFACGGDGDERPIDTRPAADEPACEAVHATLDDVVADAAGAPANATVCLADGSYGRMELTEDRTSRVTIRAEHPGRATLAGVTVDGDNHTIARFRVRGSVDILADVNGTTVDHNLIESGRHYGVMVCAASPPSQCDDVTVSGNRFEGPMVEDQIRANVYHDSDDPDPYGLLVVGNEFVGNQETGEHNDVFQSVWVGDGLFLRKNYVHDFGGQGLFVKDQAPAIDRLVVENNLIVRQNLPCNPRELCPGFQLTPFQLWGPARNARIAHNTIWPDGGPAMLRGEGWEGPVELEDNVMQTLDTDVGGLAGVELRSAGNLFCSNPNGRFPLSGFAKDCSPPFAAPEKGDYRLPGGQGVDWSAAEQHYGP